MNLDAFEWVSSMVRLESLERSAQGSTRQFTLSAAKEIEDQAVQKAMTITRDAQVIGYEPQILGVLDLLKSQELFRACD